VRRLKREQHRQSVSQISAGRSTHSVTLYYWNKAWPPQGKIAPTIKKDPEGWAVIHKSTEVLEPLIKKTAKPKAWYRKRVQ